MSGDYWEGPNGHLSPTTGDPYNGGGRRVLVASGTRRREIIIDRGENDGIDFDHQQDYLRQQLDLKVTHLEECSVGTRVTTHQFHKESGLMVSATVFTRQERVVMERVSLEVHPHQHLIDEGRARRNQLRALADVATSEQTPEEARSLLQKAIKILNTPISLRRA